MTPFLERKSTRPKTSFQWPTRVKRLTAQYDIQLWHPNVQLCILPSSPHYLKQQSQSITLAVDLAVLFQKDFAAEGKCCWTISLQLTVTSTSSFIMQDKPLSCKQFCWDHLRWSVKSDSTGHSNASAHGHSSSGEFRHILLTQVALGFQLATELPASNPKQLRSLDSHIQTMGFFEKATAWVRVASLSYVSTGLQ